MKPSKIIIAILTLLLVLCSCQSIKNEQGTNKMETTITPKAPEVQDAKENVIDTIKKIGANYFIVLQKLRLDYFDEGKLEKDSMIDFALYYNLMYNHEKQTIIDKWYIRDETVNNTIQSFFNIEGNELGSMNSSIKPVHYNDGLYYKLPDYAYENHLLDISSFITKVNHIKDDVYQVYVTDYVTLDKQEFIYDNIKSTIKYNSDKGIYQLIEYNTIERLEGWR